MNDLRPVFARRLQSVIDDSEAPLIAEALGVGANLVRGWHRGERLPSLGNFRALVVHLDCAPADYFLGLCDLAPPPFDACGDLEA